MYSFRQDFRFALRQLRKSPGFTIVAVLTLALGIGAATAMFSVIYATVLRPLPFHDPDRILFVETHAAAAFIQPASWPGYLDERAQNQSFEALAGFSQLRGRQSRYRLAGRTSAQHLDQRPLLRCSWRSAAAGTHLRSRAKSRTAATTSPCSAMKSGSRTLAAIPSVIGTSVHIDGFPYTIVGVMPAGFRFPFGMPNLVYTPLRIPKELRTARGDHWLQVIGRLKPGLTAAAGAGRHEPRAGQHRPGLSRHRQGPHGARDAADHAHHRPGPAAGACGSWRRACCSCCSSPASMLP